MKKPKRNLDKIRTSIREYTSLLTAFEDGATPEDIKRGIVELLAPYFTDRKVLDEMAVNVLVPDAIEFARIREDKWALDLFENALNSHNRARALDTQSSLRACVDWLPSTYEGLSLFWSQFHLEVDAETLELEEFVKVRFGEIGTITEGLIKPVARELLHQIRIAQGEHPTIPEIRALDFGKVIEGLMIGSGYAAFFAPVPWEIRVSQWRNIAQHFSVSIEYDRIVCRYGRPEKVIRLTRADVQEVAERLYTLFSSMRLAQRLFFIDNLYTIQALGFLPTDIKERPEILLLNFTAGLASQGYELIDFQNTAQGATAIIRDASVLDPNERRLHVVQFAGVLWLHTKAARVTVEYLERDGTPNFRVQADQELLERIQKGVVEPSALAAEAEFTDLKTNKVIPPLPKGAG